MHEVQMDLQMLNHKIPIMIKVMSPKKCPQENDYSLSEDVIRVA